MEGKYRTDDAFIESFFQKGDLLPAIVQEVGTNEVLMLAYKMCIRDSCILSPTAFPAPSIAASMIPVWTGI